MIVKEHFTTRNYAQMDGVWYDVFNHFIDLQDTCRPDFDEDGNEWFYVKFEKFRFINIVKTLYEKLNTRNSRHLVKELHEQLKPAEIRKNKFCIAKVDKLECDPDSHITEYERNIIFGALYYVLYKQQDELVEPSVVEKVKQQALYPGNPYPHYVNYFVNKLSEEPQVKESEHPTEESSELIVELNLSKEEKRELYKEIKAYKLWIEKEVTHIRELINEGRLHAKYLTDYGVAQECIKECAILLCKDSDVINSEVVQAKSGICIDNIREFIYRNFPTCHEKYKDSYTYKLDFTKHAQQTEVVEDVIPVTTPQPTEEPIVETTDTDDEQKVNASVEYTHEQLLDLIYKKNDDEKDKESKKILIGTCYKKESKRAQYLTKSKVIKKFINLEKQFNLDNLTHELQAKVITAWAKELGVLQLIQGGEFKKGDVDAAYK